MPRAIYRDTVIAESDETVVVEGNHYFPRDALREEFFQPSEESSVCPWKGRASYLDVVVGEDRAAGAAWYYPETKPKAESIRGHVAFWRGVEVVAQPILYVRRVLEKVDLAAAAAALPDQWVPNTVGSYNGDHVQVIRVEGEFVWHHHDRTDDLFICLSGSVRVQLRDGDVDLNPGEMLIVPVGVEHCVYAEKEAHLLVLEHLGDDVAEPAEAEMSGPIFGLQMSVKHPAQRNDSQRSPFDRLAEAVSNLTASPAFFGLVLLLGAAWALSYALGASDGVKHLLEGLMAFLSLLLLVILKNAERRAELVIHEKLDALVCDRLEARGEPDVDAIAVLRRARGLHDEV